MTKRQALFAAVVCLLLAALLAGLYPAVTASAANGSNQYAATADTSTESLGTPAIEGRQCMYARWYNGKTQYSGWVKCDSFKYSSRNGWFWYDVRIVE